MSVVLTKVELKNWFNYKGNYSDNILIFNEGLNIVVGDNNAGKTKFHNALRWMLTESIILEDEDGETFDQTSINENTLLSVLNQSYFFETKIGEQLECGIKIHFDELKRGKKESWIIEKLIKCTKDTDDAIKSFKFLPNVKLVDNKTKKPASSSEDFEKVVRKLIPNQYLNYFFIEGEQLGLMTPLKGPNLKTTINSLVEIKVLDEATLRAKNLKRYVNEKKSSIELDQDNLNEEVELAITQNEELETQNDEYVNSIEVYSQKVNDNKAMINKYKSRNETSKRNKELYKKYDAIVNEIKINEKLNEQYILDYIRSYFSPSIFNLSKIDDDFDIKTSIENHISTINSIISARRVELNSDLTNKEQEMIMALEKSQPKPEILEKMVSDNICYVCSDPLNEKSKDYINKKLIPFFKGELENDDLLSNLEQIQNLFNSLNISSSQFYNQDSEAFNQYGEQIIDSLTALEDSEETKIKFIKDNGEPEDDENDDSNIITYSTALEELSKAQNEIDELNELIKSNKKTIKQNESIINEHDDGEESPELSNVRSLDKFIGSIKDYLSNYKDKMYLEFAKELGAKATDRYQQFMEYNIISSKLKIDVRTKLNHKEEYDFNIKVVNSFGQIQEQPGGADQALRRVAVVFALLDYAQNKNGYPFIADAPVSKLSPSTKKAFFKSLLNDKALHQTIIFNMDLWDAENKKINDIGTEILSLLNDEPTSKFALLKSNIGNTGVDVEYLKN